MPRRSIPVHVLTAGQGCARFRRLAAAWARCIPTFAVEQLDALRYGDLGGITSPTKGRGRELFKE
jgi:hypothetical protein